MSGLIRLAELPRRGELRRVASEVLHFREIDSTSAFLLREAAFLADGTVAVAEHQSAGRGRLGRSWIEPRGSSILLSLLLKEPSASPLITGATMLACVAACEAIDASVDDVRPRVRWPNDLVVGERKLGGVLAESTPLPGDAETRALVIGIGLNCLQQAGHFDEALAGRATSLELVSRHPIDRTPVLSALLRTLDARLAPARVDGECLFAAWRQRSADIGRTLSVVAAGEALCGRVIDIGPEGDLLLELPTGQQRRLPAATTTRPRHP